MKVKHLAVFIAALMMLPFSVQAQVMVVAGAGASFEDGGTFAMFVGGDIPLESDTTGFRTFTRVAFHYTDHYNAEENQGLDFWLMTKRNIWSWLYGSVGGGMSYNFKDGKDEQGAGVKIELGFVPAKMAAFIIGIEHLPDAGTDGRNITFIYGGINLLP